MADLFGSCNAILDAAAHLLFAEAVRFLHAHGVLHRDLKPSNVLLDANWVAKIADFGTSCLCEGDANAQKTAGTPTFFSPEMCTSGTAGTSSPLQTPQVAGHWKRTTSETALLVHRPCAAASASR